MRALDEREEAITHGQDLLRLNPVNNQGMRNILVNWLLAVGAGVLLKQYQGEETAAWTNTKALWTFRQKGKGSVATRALKATLRVNPYVPFYLFGVWDMPKELPEYVGLGEENEAVVYVEEAGENWDETPGALDWFSDLMDSIATPPTRRASRR